MQNDEESFEGEARHIVRSISIPSSTSETEKFSIDSLKTSVSELSFSSDCSESDYTVIEQWRSVRNEEPIVELPATPPHAEREFGGRFLSLHETLTPATVGEALEKSGTVLMQRSRENRLAKQLEEMQALMVDDEKLVVLKQPSVQQMQSQPAFAKEVLKGFLEHSETMFHLVHDTQGSNAQEVVGVEETVGMEKSQPQDTVPTADRTDEQNTVNEFVGCFSKDNDMALYRRSAMNAHVEGRDQEGIDTLIAQHAQCLVEADEVTQPYIQICQSNDDDLIALFSFSDHSSAVLKTPKATIDGVSSYENLHRVLLQTYRQLLNRPDEMISMQTPATAGSTGLPKESSRMADHTHRPKVDLQQSLSGVTASFGLTNESESGLALQGSSKNWIKCPDARNAADIVTNLRLLIEEYILKDTPTTALAVKFFSHLLVDILQCTPAEVDEEFRGISLIDKVKHVVDDLLIPQEMENPLLIVNQVRFTIAEICAHRPHLATITSGSSAWATILETLERLVCELDHEMEHPDAFIEALQYAVRSVLDASCSAELLEQKLDDPQDTKLCNKGLQDLPIPGTECIESFRTPAGCACFISWVLVLLCSSIAWLKEQLVNFWVFFNTTPPILVGPSVSFRETVINDNAAVQEIRVQQPHLNQNIDLLRVVLEKPHPTNAEDGKPSVNVRSVELFAQLLQQPGSIDLSHSDSHHNIHLQLRDGVSCDLEKHQAEEFVTLTGTIRDHDGDVAVVFEARMADLSSLAQVESVMECVTRIEHLSSDLDDSRDVSAENIAETERNVMAASSVDNAQDGFIVRSIIEDVAFGMAPERVEQSDMDAIVEEFKRCLQELLEPLTIAVYDIYERMADTGNERLPHRQATSSENYAVELAESNESSMVPTKMEDVSVTERAVGESAGASEPLYTINECCHLTDSTFAEPLQEILSLFRDANDRLAIIDSDVTAIRNQMQQLVTEQQQQQRKIVKPTHGDGHQSSRKNSKKPTDSNRQETYNGKLDGLVPNPSCPLQEKFLLPHTNQYCPVDVYSCHAVAPDVLVVHWTVDKDSQDCIVGYEIHVDGVLRSVCFSSKRRTALIAKIDLGQQHQIAVYPTPKNRCKDSTEWPPGLFLYHL